MEHHARKRPEPDGLDSTKSRLLGGSVSSLTAASKADWNEGELTYIKVTLAVVRKAGDCSARNSGER
jgi:hypothetical protein